MLHQIQINRTICGSRSAISQLRCKIDQSRMSITKGQEHRALALKNKQKKLLADNCQHMFSLSYTKPRF